MSVRVRVEQDRLYTPGSESGPDDTGNCGPCFSPHTSAPTLSPTPLPPTQCEDQEQTGCCPGRALHVERGGVGCVQELTSVVSGATLSLGQLKAETGHCPLRRSTAPLWALRPPALWSPLTPCSPRSASSDEPQHHAPGPHVQT